jgi:hypothetical protein
MQKLIEKHQKAIAILEMIAECDRRIANAEKPNVIYNFVDIQDYYKGRLIINTQIKTRLWQSYQNFMNGTLNV